jgi:mono/diheme cytochrome c family protein
VNLGFAVLALLVSASSAVAQSGPRSVQDGVYSSAQAERGEAVFREVCVSCHATTEFKGDDFHLAWSGRTLRDLFRLISTTMPNENPGALSRQQYIDVVAYLLDLNEYPAGASDLGSDESALRRIRIEKANVKQE